MDSIRLFLFLGIGLSMDTFSLSIIYGSTNMNDKKRILLSILVGMFHFIMPIIGYLLTRLLTHNIINVINTDIITGIILLLLSIDMIINKDEQITASLSRYEALLFAFTVSVDSLSIGAALGLQNTNILLASTIFCICSFLFTIWGLNIGKKINKKFNNKINLLGAIILFIISLKYIISSF